MRRLRIELGAVRVRKPRGIARVFDGGALHAKANAEEGNLVLAGVLDGVDHALNSALAKAAGNEDAVVVFQALFGCLQGIDFLGFDPFDHGFVIVRQAAVQQRFAQAFVGVFQLNVFADNADAHFALGMVQAIQHVQPGPHVRGAIFQAKQAQ